MNLSRLVFRSLRHYRRANAGLLAGAALATAILTGALAVGDSVRHSLRQQALRRIGRATLALASQGTFFRDALATELGEELGANVAPMVVLPAAVTNSEGDLRTGGASALGIDGRFWQLGPGGYAQLGDGEAAVSEALARELKLSVGDELVARVDKPSLLSRDAPLSTIVDATVALRLKVAAIVGPSAFGEFGLSANQAPAKSVFLPLNALQRAVGMEGRANLLLTGASAEPSAATSALWKRWSLDDSGLTIRPAPTFLELRTRRVFLDPTVGDAAVQAVPAARGVLTYFVNGLKVGVRETPYSTVSALDGPLTEKLNEGEIAVNSWLAEDLGAKVGDALTIRYWVLGPQRRLDERTETFKIARILPLAGAALDPALMPDIPGLSDKKNCRDWEPGVPVDLNKIRDKDQAYWEKFKGSPKAFLPLRVGQRLWDNRFGNLTAVRYPSTTATRPAIEACLKQALSPASQGLFFQPLRERALAASQSATDFGGLFFGFSLFLVAAALLLLALLFGFAIDRRRTEQGTLLALGVPAKTIRHALLSEASMIALLGAILGVGLATFYTKALLAALAGVWRDAVAGAGLSFHAEPLTLVGGGLGSVAASVLTAWLVVRRQGTLPARVLLSRAVPESPTAPKRGGFVASAVLATLGVGLALAGIGQSGEAAAGLAFGAGASILVAGLLACRPLLNKLSHAPLGLRSVARRPGRSLSAIALLACGVFLVVAVGASRHDPREDAEKKTSGTGGFALWGESALPIYAPLDADGPIPGASVVALRVRDGDDASCVNLNRAQTPRVLGVDPKSLAGRFGGDWDALVKTDPDGAIPAIGDTNTVVWALGKKPGDTLDYLDDKGVTRKLRIAGVVPNAVFQGSLVIAEDHFVRLFPERAGYRAFLIDAPKARRDEIRRELTRAGEDSGLSITPTGDRLAAFQTVENTYLSIFGALGGLGLLLGTAGLGLIVLRNVEERRGELALLRAVGFESGQLQKLLLTEHGILLGLGMALGLLAGLVAILPSLRHAPPLGPLLLILVGVAGAGLASVYFAASAASRQNLLDALRDE